MQNPSYYGNVIPFSYQGSDLMYKKVLDGVAPAWRVEMKAISSIPTYELQANLLPIYQRNLPTSQKYLEIIDGSELVYKKVLDGVAPAWRVEMKAIRSIPTYELRANLLPIYQRNLSTSRKDLEIINDV